MTNDYITATQAREELGLTKEALRKLLNSGALPWESHPTDKRVKLIKRTAVEAYKARIAGLPRAKYERKR